MPLRSREEVVEVQGPTLATTQRLIIRWSAPCGRGRQQILGNAGKPAGMKFGTDASFFGPVGITSVVCGPGSIDQAHFDDEWVEIRDVARGAEILAEAMLAIG